VNIPNGVEICIPLEASALCSSNCAKADIAIALEVINNLFRYKNNVEMISMNDPVILLRINSFIR
jgi:hypothetical protein